MNAEHFQRKTNVIRKAIAAFHPYLGRTMRPAVLRLRWHDLVDSCRRRIRRHRQYTFADQCVGERGFTGAESAEQRNREAVALQPLRLLLQGAADALQRRQARELLRAGG